MKVFFVKYFEIWHNFRADYTTDLYFTGSKIGFLRRNKKKEGRINYK